MFYMTEHLLEAIVINFKRSKLYSKRTDGNSLFISYFLISTEVITLPLSFFLDLLAKFWQFQGVPVLVHEFIPMSETSNYHDSYPFQFDEFAEFPLYDFEGDSGALWRALTKRDYVAMSAAFEEALKKLEKYPQFFCMYRHLLESGLRCVNLAQKHIEVSKEKKVISPNWFCLYLAFAHIAPLRLGLYLDRKAFEVQKNGVPIIYQDVPPIPPFPSEY